MKTFFFFFLSLPAFHSKCQSYSGNYITYYNLVNKGKFYEQINEPDKAIPLFLKAFDTVPQAHCFDEFHLARCYAMKKDTQKVMFWLLKSIGDNFFYKYNKIARNDSLFGFLDSTLVVVINDADEVAYQNYCKNGIVKQWQDSVLYYFYNDAMFHDANNRKIALNRGKEYIDSTLSSYSQFQDKLVNFILQSGYPSLFRCGNDIFCVPLWHLSYEKKVKLKPFLFEELKRGNITPDSYAGFCEKIEFDNGLTGECLYFLLVRDCTSGNWKDVINNRLSIGLNIYLDEGDYIYNKVSGRSLLPWINQVVK